MIIKTRIIFVMSLLCFSSVNAHTTQETPKVYSLDASYWLQTN